MGPGIPKHVAIIMDGNGRWAKSRGLPRFEGHRRGAAIIRKILKHAEKRGVKILTLYAFSVENWERPGAEVSLLMRLLKSYVAKERAEFVKNKVRMTTIGDLSRLPEAVRAEVVKTVEATQHSTGITLQLALSYGGRDEILRACNRLIAQNVQAVDEQEFRKALDTGGLPDPDVVIRTSGEQRISNFLLWQAAYAEFVVTPVLWPEFDEAEFDRVIKEYQGRSRRFGRVDVKEAGEDPQGKLSQSLLSKKRASKA